jgi:hypothetical protein
MPRPTKIRRALKWTGTIVCALLTLPYVFYVYQVSWIDRDGERSISLVKGSISYVRPPARWPRFDPPYGWNVERWPWPDVWVARWWWPPVSLDSWGAFGSPASLVGIHVRVWLLLACAAALTGLLWWLDRHRSPGHCQACGYDLTGNVSGRCPECGALIAHVAETDKKGTP